MAVPVQAEFAVPVAADIGDCLPAVIGREIEKSGMERTVLQRQIGLELTAEQRNGRRPGQTAAGANAVVVGRLAGDGARRVSDAVRALADGVIEIAVAGDGRFIRAVA